MSIKQDALSTGLSKKIKNFKTMRTEAASWPHTLSIFGWLKLFSVPKESRNNMGYACQASWLNERIFLRTAGKI